MFRATSQAGADGRGGRVRLTPAQMAGIVNAAARAGKIHPRSRDAWLVRVARGGREGGQAIHDLLHLVPADPVTRASWPGDRPADDGQAEQDELYSALYPDPGDERVVRELERRERRRAQEASRQAQLAHADDNTLAAAAPDPDPAASGIAARRMERIRRDPADLAAGMIDGQLYDQLFGPDAGL